MKIEKKTTGDSRTRNFATVVYPESAPVNWLEIIAEMKIPIFVSPLHDKDINPTGEPKKPHYHIMMMFEGKKSENQIREMFEKFGGVGLEVVQSMRGYARYLCHLDNPEKAQYDTKDVICYGGADYATIINLTSDKYNALCEMEEFCERYNVVSFYVLSRYASLNRRDWSRVLKDNGAVYMEKYLKSRRWSIENNCTQIIDPETGEVIM